MNKHLQMVREFHDAFNFKQQPHGEMRELTRLERIMRLSLLQEEYAEILRAVAARNKIGVLDGLVDLSYFALGTLAMIGANIGEDEKEPHMENEFINWLNDVMKEVSADSLQYTSYLPGSLEDIYECCKALAKHWLHADFDKAFEIVQASNMSKLGEDGKPIYDAAGKIRKGPNFVEPDLSLTLHESEIDWVSLA
jgi:predicted HAD superfamily Cof-like phosphohydrolase